MRVFSMVVLLALPTIVAAAEIEGTIEIFSEGKRLRSEEAAEAIVYFRPANPPALEKAAQPFVVVTERKQFVPRILPITVGSEVRFVNQDPILHNAFSTSKNNAFDAGFSGPGEQKSFTFKHAGYVRVFCNVHHSMIGHILVLDTPYFVRPDSAGKFRLSGLPSGPGDLVVWHDRATPWHAQVNPGTGKSVRVALELAQRKIPPHTNKFGKPYGRSGSDGY